MNPQKKEYAQRVREVEHGVFTPLLLSATGGMGREAATFYKRLADGISRKERKEYSVVMGWIRCRLPFAILRSAILCIRGSRSSRHHPVHEINIELATSGECSLCRALKCDVLCIHLFGCCGLLSFLLLPFYS